MDKLVALSQAVDAAARAEHPNVDGVSIGSPANSATWELSFKNVPPGKAVRDQATANVRAKVKPKDFGY